MIIEEHGDLLKKDVQIKVHQVNCQGVMGSGLAKKIRDLYPIVYNKYKECCSKRTPNELLGGIQIIAVDDTHYYCNLFGQLNYGRGKLQTDYKKFEQALYLLNNYVINHNIVSIAFPKYIGCCLAGGDWSIVYNLIQKYFGENCKDITCYIIEY